MEGAFGGLGLKLAAGIKTGLKEINGILGLTGKAADDNFSLMSDRVTDLSNRLNVAQGIIVEGLYQALSAGDPDSGTRLRSLIDPATFATAQERRMTRKSRPSGY